ncbi:IclR family transcriptional regulator [Bordetella genomosp. 11]|uniref:IclR family transcriptional regulator n=1 Tax=Bordetella genomosp. 11 TaxID=1416808 RepID=A0A261UCW9_9BORD|nr:IclR family transcriptional regulator C-terminal domain-containing protein [Bordetella genomosp. 11]OZI59455.1 IclR family transcriptional regulator [Bordetella genomosp. 11]
MNKLESAPTAGPRTLRRGLLVLDALRRAGPGGLSIMEVARATGIQRPTVYRFLDVLVEEGCASRCADTRRYSVTQTWAAPVDTHAAAMARLKPALRRISDETGDAAFLVCRSGGDSLCLHREVGSYPVQVLVVTVGHRQPLGVGAAGLALLAALPEQESRAIIHENRNALPAYGGMSPTQMQRLVANTRGRGWSVVGNAAVPGVVGVGAALLDARGYPVLAVSVSSTVDRMSSSRQKQVAGIIRRELDAAAPAY